MRLREQLEAARRAGKRQSAPFSKGDLKDNPAKSGRKRGESYGTKAHRPAPDHVDEEIEVPMPDCCPCCEGELEFEDEVMQYQEELVWVRGHVRGFRIARGRCQRCGRRAQGRHPAQTSDAVGAAGSQVGPGALALTAQLNKELGISMRKVSQMLEMFGVKVTPGGLYHALGRLARAAEPTYRSLALAVRQSSAVAPDETGWRIGGRKAWLWAFVGDGVTVYLIARGRGYEHAVSILGEEYAGVLERDGWAPYRRFAHAQHQSCVAHLLRRTGEMIADSVAGQAKIPHALRRILLDALGVRDAYQDLLTRRDHDPNVIESTCVEIVDQQPQLRAASAEDAPDREDREDREEIIAVGPDRQAELDREIVRLQAQIDRLIARTPTHPPNTRLLAHLHNEQGNLLTFLNVPGVQATNWRAEQAIRPAVVNRKSWGGNRTDHGAQVQQTLMSVIRTSRQQGVCPITLLSGLQHHTAPATSKMLRLPAITTPEVVDAGDARSP